MTLSKEDLVITDDKENNIMVGGVKLNTFMGKMGLSPITKVTKNTGIQEGGGFLENLAVPTILFVGNYLFKDNNSKTFNKSKKIKMTRRRLKKNNKKTRKS